MILAHFSPPWFYGAGVLLEAAFAIVSLLVALFAFRIYRKTSSVSILFLVFGFLSIALSYIIQSVLNFMIINQLSQDICRMMKIQSVATLESIGMYAHIIFYTIGVTILLFMTLREKNYKLLGLLVIVALGSILLSSNSLYMFYFIATIFLAFISWHFIRNFLKNRNIRTSLIALAFLFMLFGNFHFLISVDHQLFFAIGHILELVAYVFIAINLYLVHTS